MWIKNSGKLIYEPFRKDLKKVHKSRYLIVEPRVDDIVDYYHSFLEKEFGTYYKLQKPVWKPHVTVIEPKEKISFPEKWKYNNGEIIDFEYNIELKKHWKFWVVDVKSEKLESIRKEFGLNPKFKFHITLGREYDWQENLKGI